MGPGLPAAGEIPPAWLDELPLDPDPPDMRVGLRRIGPAEWLPPDSQSSAELALRRQLLDEHPGLIALLPGHDEAAAELLQLVEGAIGVSASGLVGIDAISRCSTTITEDCCLLARSDVGWILVGGGLLFPNFWTIQEKLGGTLSQVHAPTEGYESMLAARVGNFFDRLEPGTIVTRRNWFLNDSDEYHQPVAKPAPVPIAVAQADQIASLTLRSERQTLRRLEHSGLMVFTIKTQMVPMELAVERPGFAARMARWAQTATPRAQRLKSTVGRHDALSAWLAGRVRRVAGE